MYSECYSRISPGSASRAFHFATGLPGCHDKTRTIATQNQPKTGPIAFRRGPSLKYMPGDKMHVFCLDSPGKFAFSGAKYDVIRVAQTRGHQKLTLLEDTRTPL